MKYRTAIFWALALPVIYCISRYNYNFFHSFADGATIVVAASTFTIIWNSRYRMDNGYFLFAGVAFLFFAILDGMHLLGNKNMGIFPEYGNLGPTFYIASRYVLSVSLLVAPFFISRKVNTTAMFAVYSSITLLIVLSILYWKIFPACIIDGVGLTPFKVISDYVICLILLGAIVLLFINRQSFNPWVLKVIVYSIILSIATGLTFTLYTDPFGITNLVGHLFQLTSFYLIYLAFVETSLTKPQKIIFQKLKQKEEQLAFNLQQLDQTNVELKKEIAEREQIDSKLKHHSAQLEAANRELDSFAYAVSHDLRAPLRAMSGFSQALVEDYGPTLQGDARVYLEQIMLASRRMSDLVEGILVLSRSTRGELQRDQVDLSAMAERILAELAKGEPARQVEWLIEPGLTVQGDTRMVEAVMRNLLENAWKFTGRTTQPLIRLYAEERQGERFYCVADNGAGFDMKHIGNLFKPFQRLHRQEEFPGIGIGMATVQRIVQRHGGTIDAVAAPGKGATFYFFLPQAGMKKEAT